MAYPKLDWFKVGFTAEEETPTFSWGTLFASVSMLILRGVLQRIHKTEFPKGCSSPKKDIKRTGFPRIHGLYPSTLSTDRHFLSVTVDPKSFEWPYHFDCQRCFFCLDHQCSKTKF